jgi:hypothetical protein
MTNTNVRILISTEDGEVLDIIDGIELDDLRSEVERNPNGILATGARSIESYFPDEDDDA